MISLSDTTHRNSGVCLFPLSLPLSTDHCRPSLKLKSESEGTLLPPQSHLLPHQSYWSQANHLAQPHQWVPIFINKRNKTKIFAGSFYSFSRKFTFWNAQCEVKPRRKTNPPKSKFYTGYDTAEGEGRLAKESCLLTPVFSVWEKSLIELTNGKQIFTKYNHLIGFPS